MWLSRLLQEVGKANDCQIFGEREFQVFARVTSHVGEANCVFINEKKYISSISPMTTMVITREELRPLFAERQEGLCICENPRGLYFLLLNHAAEKGRSTFETIIGENSVISSQAYVAPDNVVIGNNVRIEEFACVYEGSVIEDNCVIRSGAKIGIQDFNYYIDGEEIHHVIHQGKTVLKKGVVVGFNSVIGRALYGYSSTSIGEQCKIGCNSSVGHDCKVGKKVLIGGNVIVGGNTIIGELVNISIGATLKNAIVIGDRVNIEMGAVVVRDVEKDRAVFGNPARTVVVPKMQE